MASKKSTLKLSQMSLFNLLDDTVLPDNVKLLHKLPSDEVKQLLAEWERRQCVAVDIETLGKESTKDALNPFWGGIRLIQIGYQGKVLILDTKHSSNRLANVFVQQLKNLLESDKQVQVFHNAIFDLSFLSIRLSIKARDVRDTMIIGKMLNAGIGLARPNSLAALCKQFLGKAPDKSHQTDDWSVNELSNSQYLYAANDVIYTEKLYYKMLKEVNSVADIDFTGRPTQYSFKDTVITECNVIPAFVDIISTGQPIDLDYARDVLRQYKEASDDLYEPVAIKLGMPYTAQPAKMLEAIKKVYGLSVKDNDGVETTSSDALFLTYCSSGEEDLLRLSLTRSLAKTITTLENLISSAEQCKGYARGGYTSLGDTASGRSTCKGKGKNSNWETLNLQNIPNHVRHPLLEKYNLPKIRSVIKHPQDDVMAIYDLSASHARYAAALSGDISLVEVMELKDPHSFLTLKLASLVGHDWDMDYYNNSKDTDKAVKEIRSVSKTALY